MAIDQLQICCISFGIVFCFCRKPDKGGYGNGFRPQLLASAEDHLVGVWDIITHIVFLQFSSCRAANVSRRVIRPVMLFMAVWMSIGRY